MRYFRFVGTETVACEYLIKSPKVGSVYKEDEGFGGSLMPISKLITRSSKIEKEWEEVEVKVKEKKKEKKKVEINIIEANYPSYNPYMVLEIKVYGEPKLTEDMYTKIENVFKQ